MDFFLNLIETIGGLLASLLVIIYFSNTVIFPLFTKLEVQLTKDLFFRMTNQGETFFPKIIVYSPISIQITDFSFELKGQKENTQETSYHCKAEQFGSVERNTINELSRASHYFPKSSPEFLLQKGASKEILIKCSIIGSKQHIKDAVEKLIETYLKSINNQSISDQQHRNNTQNALNKCSQDILSNIKIESGNHTLICKVDYKYKYFLRTINRKTESRINITITEEALKLYKEQVEDFLLDYLSYLNPKNRNFNPRFPEINLRGSD